MPRTRRLRAPSPARRSEASANGPPGNAESRLPRGIAPRARRRRPRERRQGKERRSAPAAGLGRAPRAADAPCSPGRTDRSSEPPGSRRAALRFARSASPGTRCPGHSQRNARLRFRAAPSRRARPAQTARGRTPPLRQPEGRRTRSPAPSPTDRRPSTAGRCTTRRAAGRRSRRGRACRGTTGSGAGPGWAESRAAARKKASAPRTRPLPGDLRIFWIIKLPRGPGIPL